MWEKVSIEVRTTLCRQFQKAFKERLIYMQTRDISCAYTWKQFNLPWSRATVAWLLPISSIFALRCLLAKIKNTRTTVDHLTTSWNFSFDCFKA